MIIGITGGIGAGKSTVSDILRSMGYPVYDSDVEARKLQNVNIELRQKIQNVLGADIYKKSGLDRQALANLVFNQPKLLAQLNQIVHPAVKADFENWVNSNSSSKVLFIESAILFESEFNKLTDRIIVVSASERIRIQRVVKRDGTTYEQVQERIKRQIDDEERKKWADEIIYTDDDKNTLTEKIQAALEHLLS